MLCDGSKHFLKANLVCTVIVKDQSHCSLFSILMMDII